MEPIPVTHDQQPFLSEEESTADSAAGFVVTSGETQMDLQAITIDESLPLMVPTLTL